VAELLDIIVKLLPNPSEANPPDFLNGEGEDAQPMHAEPDPAKHVLAHVFKVTADPFVGKLGIFRVHQGTVTQGQPALRRRRPQALQGGHLFMLQGKDTSRCRAPAGRHRRGGQGGRDLHFDAVLHDAAEDDHIHLKPLDFPVPVHGLAIGPSAMATSSACGRS
jgi:elongation factor G